ncbi:MAG: hypothetical protein DRG33_03890 [Deltaproteobacteria bacterium]|nr:MAG: hypothetical protein DRG33_03890 [Deltaproteobacteria bacterium]
MKDIIVCPHLAISTPFVANNDSVRNQMAASQARQAVPLVDAEPPIVETTLERAYKILFPDIVKAKRDCKVVFASTRLVVVQYLDDKSYDVFPVDYTYKIPQVGQIYEKDQVITYKLGYFNDDGDLCQGKNLLCSIVLNPWSYEDAIVLGSHVELTSYRYHVIERVIPESCILLSLSKRRYKIVPDVGDIVKKFEPILIIKSADPKKLLEDPEEVTLNVDAEVIDVEIVGNRWNKTVRGYDVAVLDFLQTKEKLRRKVEQEISDKQVVAEIIKRHYLFDRSRNKDIKLSKKSFDLYVRIVLRSKDEIEVGDKLTNRHAAKGVVSLITDDMYVTEDGRKVDINIDIMSIISRMNIGQVYEAIAGACIYHLEKKLKQFDDLDEAKRYLIGFYETIDNTEEKWITQQAKEQLDNINSLEDLQRLKLTFPAPPFESPTREQLLQACLYINPNLKENIHKYFESQERPLKPEEMPDLSPLLEKLTYRGKTFYATCGYVYFYKLVHMAKDKLAARGSEKFVKKTLQPTGGRRNQGGQRFGEYEVWCLLAYSALFNLEETLKLKADDVVQKIKYILKKLYDSDLDLPERELEVVRLFRAYLQIMRSRIVDD